MRVVFSLFLGLCLMSSAASAQDQFSEYLTVSGKYLQLPVKNGAPKKNIEIWKDGVLVRFFDIELADDNADWFAYLDISEWNGRKVELRVDKLDRSSKAFHPIVQTNEDTNAGSVYAEPLRGQFHFSPKRGWTNDPNGLVYYQGNYHLFFQHNPYGRGWGNMTWGHAISKDLIHWEEVGDALHPDGFGPMFSGSAVVDSANTSGLGTSDNPAMVLFFTGAKCWCQGLAWSTDGMHFYKMDKAAVPRVNRDNRDPKVFWHEPSKHWVMLFWVEENDGGHTMQFFKSTNLKDWQPTSVTRGGKGDDRYLFECPDFFELPVDGNLSNKKWVLSGANSMYAIGNFDGETFTPEVERLRGQVGRDYYAAQTINNEPTGRRIEIGWWRTHTDKGQSSFNQSMSIPMELRLINTAAGVQMIRVPVKELEQLRGEKLYSGATTLTEKSANPLAGVQAELLEINTVMQPGKASELQLNLNGLNLVYNVSKQEMTVDGVTASMPLLKGKLELQIFVDRIGVEIFANGGRVFMPINKNLSGKQAGISVKGGKLKLTTLDVYALQSAW